MILGGGRSKLSGDDDGALTLPNMIDLPLISLFLLDWRGYFDGKEKEWRITRQNWV